MCNLLACVVPTYVASESVNFIKYLVCHLVQNVYLAIYISPGTFCVLASLMIISTHWLSGFIYGYVVRRLVIIIIIILLIYHFIYVLISQLLNNYYILL